MEVGSRSSHASSICLSCGILEKVFANSSVWCACAYASAYVCCPSASSWTKPSRLPIQLLDGLVDFGAANRALGPYLTLPLLIRALQFHRLVLLFAVMKIFSSGILLLSSTLKADHRVLTMRINAALSTAG